MIETFSILVIVWASLVMIGLGITVLLLPFTLLLMRINPGPALSDLERALHASPD